MLGINWLKDEILIKILHKKLTLYLSNLLTQFNVNSD